MFSKLSILVLFLRYLPRKPKKMIYTTIVVVILYSLIGSFGWMFACQPIEKFWDLRITRGSCIEWSKINIFSGVMNTATDTVILLLPIFMLRKVRLPRWEKIGLVLIVMTGRLYAPTQTSLEVKCANVRNGSRLPGCRTEVRPLQRLCLVGAHQPFLSVVSQRTSS